jgi:hypothetical protein
MQGGGVQTGGTQTGGVQTGGVHGTQNVLQKLSKSQWSVFLQHPPSSQIRLHPESSWSSSP